MFISGFDMPKESSASTFLNRYFLLWSRLNLQKKEDNSAHKRLFQLAGKNKECTFNDCKS